MITEVRDPFVFDFEGHRYAIQGAGSAGGDPQILIYDCDDLHRLASARAAADHRRSGGRRGGAGQHLGVPEPVPARGPLGADRVPVAVRERRPTCWPASGT